ncbi:MAG: type 1 glutamine amidotransferase [Bacteroidetes bacterium]|jgi:GMP synthase (glutamine-hydrolysing)|nr:type 1 glutamine amidotransferase [Bacteroidota bacterium]
MPRPHIALIDATLGDTHAQRNFKREVDATLTIFRASAGEIPQPVAPEEEAKPAEASVTPPYDAVIISGSQSSVYHDEPWMAELATWVRSAIAAGLPVLGVCWGHQLLAEILGGTVDDRGAYELGYVEVEQVHDDPLFEDVPTPFVAFATHSDEVMALPDDVTVLARNASGIQAFRKDRVYGVQFHPEYDMRTAEDMIQRKDISMRAMQAALDSVTPEHLEAAQDTKQIFGNFLDFVQEVKEERLEATD